MATLTAKSVLQEGTKAPFAVAGSGGDKVSATGLGTVLVEFRNEAAGSITVTLDAPDTVINDPVYGRLQKADSVLDLAAGEEGAFSLANPFGLADDAGFVSFTYSSAAGLKIRAIRA